MRLGRAGGPAVSDAFDIVDQTARQHSDDVRAEGRILHIEVDHLFEGDRQHLYVGGAGCARGAPLERREERDFTQQFVRADADGDLLEHDGA